MASHPDLRRSQTAELAGIALAILSILSAPSRPARAEFTFEVMKSFELPERGPGALVLGSDGALYGSTMRGGSVDAGTIFRIASDGSYTRLHSFNPTDGSSPSWCRPANSSCDFRSPLVLGSDGALYGTSYGAGSYDLGSVFRIDNAGSFTLLHSFNGTDGAHPARIANTSLYLDPAALDIGSDGALYGTTYSGGSFGRGTIFRIDDAGNFTSLHSFSGARPSGPLVAGQDGALYGTAASSRESAGSTETVYYGMVYRIDGDGIFTILHSFDESDGYSLNSTLVLGSDGAVYGTTMFGGSSNSGTVFRIDSAGTFTRLHSFSGTEGALPEAALILGHDGALYGTTLAGSYRPPYGWDGPGTVFQIDSAGNFTSLHPPTRATSFVLGGDGAVYGTTGNTIFRIDSAGNVPTVHSFPPYTSGPYYAFGPARSLVLGSDGALYGTTPTDFVEPPFWDPHSYFASTHGVNGTVFRVDSTGTFSTLHEFESPDGFHLQPVLAVGGDGAVYGATYEGSALHSGTLFKVDRAGSFASLHDFSNDDLGGNGPPPYYFPLRGTLAALARGGDGAVYGITPYGGESGAGAVFKVDSAGTFEFVHSLGGSFGSAARASLVLGSDGTLYRSGDSVFQIDSAGVFTSLVESFDTQRCEALGQYPMDSYSGPVARGSDGLLYGVNALSCGYGKGSTSQYDAIFRRDDAGTLTFFHSFADSDYSSPTDLVAGSDGALYGKRYGGGGPSGGSIFRLDGAGLVTTVQAFPAYGSGPSSSPFVLGSDGALYGTTPVGGASNQGSIFKIDAAANFSTVHSFGGADGYYANGPLVSANNGSIYGTTLFGGASNAGTVFQMDRTGAFRSVYSYSSSPVDFWPTGSKPHFVVAGEDCSLYGVGTGGPAGGGILYRLFEPGHLCQRIQLDPISDRTLGDPPFIIDATASSGLPVSFTASGVCRITGATVSLNGVGVCTVSGSQVGDASYEPAAEVSQTFRVLFDFAGFLPPVRDPAALNPVNAGRVVPVSFQIAGDPGSNVLEAGLVRRVACDTLAPESGFETADSPGTTALDAATSSGQYTLPWKTRKTWAGTCRELALELIDGSVHSAYFSFRS